MIKNRLRLAIFIIVYSLSCLTISTNKFGGYFSYTTTLNLIIKFLLIFICVFSATIINKVNEKQIIRYSSIFINITLLLYIFDYFVTQISGSAVYYRMWWLCSIFITQAAFYIAGRLMKYDDFFKKFWLSFMPTYTFSFVLIFIRKPYTYFSTNLKLGNGLLSNMGYLISHIKGNTWPLFNLVGNVMFFVPIPFLIKMLFNNKLKSYQIFILGLLVPFFIEGYQYIFKCGDVDIDDIILNISGYILGFIIFLIDKKVELKQQSRQY